MLLLGLSFLHPAACAQQRVHPKQCTEAGYALRNVCNSVLLC